MKNIISVFALLAVAIPAQATLVSVSGPLSNRGDAAAIIAAPADANDDAPGATNRGQEGFNERQDVLLTSALLVDGGSIAAGANVDSHMIFLNTAVGDGGAVHLNVDWLFDGIILGVMSNSTGSLEVASSGLLGAPGTLYPAAAFAARGLESNDGYSGVGTNTLTVNMRVSEPGDWIRVITVPEPSALLLMGLGVLGLSIIRKKS